jgi:hypothetical protein
VVNLDQNAEIARGPERTPGHLRLAPNIIHARNVRQCGNVGLRHTFLGKRRRDQQHRGDRGRDAGTRTITKCG